MKNPFKIYKPVKELVKDIRENPEKYTLIITGSDFIYFYCKDESNWYGAFSPIGLGMVWANDNFVWTTWREKWYLYKELKKISLAQVPKSPETTRQGWVKKLGLEE